MYVHHLFSRCTVHVRKYSVGQVSLIIAPLLPPRSHSCSGGECEGEGVEGLLVEVLAVLGEKEAVRAITQLMLTYSSLFELAQSQGKCGCGLNTRMGVVLVIP